jgi:hypothetical protein
MAETVSSQDVALFLQLSKERAEYAFMQKVAASNGSKPEIVESVQRNLRDTSSKLDALKTKLDKAGLAIVVPNEARIKELTDKINEENHDSFVMAIKSKSGPLYELIAERGALIKKNFEMRDEIGKLNIFIHKLDANSRKSVIKAISAGALDISDLSKVKDERSKSRLLKVMQRLGISGLEPKGEETEVNLGGSKVWVSSQLADDVKKNFDSIQALNAKIQLKNAERQIRSFNEDEEKEFAKIQSEYLALLKSQDTLLKEYKEENSERIVISS